MLWETWQIIRCLKMLQISGLIERRRTKCDKGLVWDIHKKERLKKCHNIFIKKCWDIEKSWLNKISIGYSEISWHLSKRLSPWEDIQHIHRILWKVEPNRWGFCPDRRCLFPCEYKLQIIQSTTLLVDGNEGWINTTIINERKIKTKQFINRDYRLFEGSV